MLVLQNMERAAPHLTGITVTPIALDVTSTKFDLTLELSEETNALSATAEYSTDLFDASTITRMLGHLQVLLGGVLANPAERISRLPLLTDSERRRVVSVWNETACEYPRDRTLPQLFEEQVARTPHAVALRDGARCVTFGALNVLANRLAHDLQERGVGRGTFIGVCLHRSIEMTVAVLGILKAGGAYLPLDPAHPVTRLRFMVEDANVPLVLTHERTHAVARALSVPALRLDGESSVVAIEPPDSLSTGAVAEDPAYLMYTSGSTGLPKGIVSPHRATVNRLFWMWNAYPFAPGEVACQKTSPSFVDSAWEIFGPLLQGVPSVVVPEDTVRDVPELIQLLARHGVTRIVLVPSLLRSILDHAEERLQALLPALNFWVSSGEVLPAGLVARFRDALPDGRLLNLYGSTEVAADATCYELPPTHSGRVPVGRPIDNLRVYILDRERQPVPIGIVGRLHVAGTGLAVGYWNSPELTAERFVTDPFGDEPDARMYDTGDLGRYLAGGTIELCGRVDDQLKLRGVRIAPGEIEARLREHPAVTDAVVAVRCDDVDDQRLVAYVAATPAVTTGDLRDFAARVLPSAMVPAGFVVLPELPRTPHGKVDRDALPRPEWAQMVPRATRITPRTAMERQIATIWSDVLSIGDLGIEDSFFDLGGHSLMAMQVASRMWRQFGIDVPVRLLFEHPTIQDLAAALTRSGFSEQAEEAALQPSHAADGEQPWN
jgi:amino acid adenylation domain-containing protein